MVMSFSSTARTALRIGKNSALLGNNRGTMLSMGVIVPAVLVATRKELEEKLTQLVGIVDVVQIDAVDGQFATSLSWPYVSDNNEIDELVRRGEDIPRSDQLRVEADLMVEDVVGVAGQWVTAGATRIVLHSKDIANFCTVLKNLSVYLGHEKDFIPEMLSIGIALMPDDEPSVIEPMIDCIDFVQYMGIAHVGRQGEPFDTRVVERVRTSRVLYPDLPMQVDGGISLANAPMLLDAGVSRLVIGSSIFGKNGDASVHDVGIRIREFEELARSHGIYE